MVWTYQPRSWAAVSCDLDQAGILDMAERVRFEPHPMHLPFRLSGLPEHIALTDVIESDGRTRGPGHPAVPDAEDREAAEST